MTFTTEPHPGVCAAPPIASDGFVLDHTMPRVKDPARSRRASATSVWAGALS